MATGVEQKAKASTPKYESFVEAQIARVQLRVRAQDAGKAGILFLIFTLAYGLGMAWVDKTWELSTLARLVGFSVFGLGAVLLLGWAVLCLLRRVNPYYAAKQLEEIVPDAKNSLVNWLDLRDEKLPPVIHEAVGLRAARDLKKADPEEAVSAGPTWILAAVLGGLILAMLIFFVMGPQQFTSLMNRIFLPFRDARIETDTFIRVLDPNDENAVVPPNRAITFRAEITGRVPAVNQPGAPMLLWRYSQADPFVSQALEKDFDESWTWTLPADQVINQGLWYKVTAGEQETPERQIRVSAIPQISAFDVIYHYRAFERKAADKGIYPKAVFTKLHARRGTEVTLHVRTNCEVSKGDLEIIWDNKNRTELPAQVLLEDPGTLRFPKFLLENSGTFRVLFTSRDGKSNIDRSPYPIIVFEEKPSVEIIKPQNITLPLNGTLRVEGVASSTIGIKGMRLRLRHEKRELGAKPYRPTKSFKLADGSYPPVLQYQDFLALEKLTTAKGELFPLSPGMKIQYWLEAFDNADYPDPNGTVGTSKEFTLTIAEPEKDQKKQQQERQKAQEEQQQHDANQDQDLQQQNEKVKNQQPGNKGDKEGQQQKELKQKEDEARKAAQQIQDKLNKQKPDAKQPPDQQPKTDKKNSDGKNSDGKNPPDKQNPKKDKGPKKANQKNENDNKGKDKKGPDQPQPNQKKDGSESKSPQPKSKDDKKNGDNKSGNDNPSKENRAGKKGPDQKEKQAKDDQKKKKNEDKQKKGGETGGGNNGAGNSGTGKENSPGGPKEKNAGGPKNAEKGDQGNDGGNGAKQPQTGQQQPKKRADEGKDKAQPGKGTGSEAPKQPGGASGGKTEPGKQTDGSKTPPGTQGPGTNTGDPKHPPGAGKKNSENKNKGNPNGASGGGKFKEPTPDEIAQLAQDLKSGNAKAKQKAEDRLAKISRESKSPEARDAAGEALHANNKGAAKAKGPDDNDKNAAQGDSKQGDTKSAGPGEGAAKSAPPEAQKGKGTGKGEGPGEGDPNRGEIAKTKGGVKKAGGWGGAANAFENDGKANAPTKEFERRGGDLSLQTLKELLKTTPQERKQAGITDAQWQQFVRAAAEYERALEKTNQGAGAGTDKLVGGTSRFNSTGPSLIKSRNGKVDPLDYKRALPPPEFREAQRNFTAGAAAGKKK